MQFSGNYKKIWLVLAIAAVFSTVAPELVGASDKKVITNVSYSSQNTGGISQDGEDGRDGEDGKPGIDGTPGLPGQSVVTGGGKSSVSVHTVSNGSEFSVSATKTTESVQFNPDDAAQVQVVSATEKATTSTSTNNTIEIFVSSGINEDSLSSRGVFQVLQKALLSLQVMFVTYVDVLF